MILSFLRYLFESASLLLDYLAGERLRLLGRLEAQKEHTEKSNEDLKTAASIESAPDERDRDKLLDRLRGPARR